MKHFLLAILVTAAALALHAQELTDTHINKVDAQGKRQGNWRVYDGEGNLKFIGEYISGKPVGQFTYFYPNGKTKAVVIHEPGGRVTRVTNYHANGNLLARGKYFDQKKDSTWQYFNEEDGLLSAEEQYEQGVKVGVWKTYYPEGNVAEELTYRNDKMQGPCVQYFTDGSVKLKCNYADDKLDGLYVIYHLKGTVEVSGTFSRNMKNGAWVYLHENGELEKREEYENGRMVSQIIDGKEMIVK